MLRQCLRVIGKGMAGEHRLRSRVKEQLHRLGLGRRASRISLSFKYIRGVGLEIGALHNPLRVAHGVTVKYVDRLSRSESIAKFTELDSDSIVEPDYIDDGFVLSSTSDASQDFLIANHVLEHSPNPLGALCNWCRVVRQNGIVFLSVPIAARCFDRGRRITGIDHLLEDFRLSNMGETDKLKQRNRVHYSEWLTISHPNALAEQGKAYSPPSKDRLESQIEDMSATLAEIHFHTFSVQSFSDLLHLFAEHIETGMKVEEIRKNRHEVVAIMRRWALAGMSRCA